MADCFDAIKKAFENDKNFTDDDIRKIVEDFTKIRETAGVSGLIEQAGQYAEMVTNREAQQAARYARTIAQYKVIKQNMAGAKNYSYALGGLLSNASEVFEGSRNSVNNLQGVKKGTWESKLFGKMEQLGLDSAEYVHSDQFSKELRTELFDIVTGKENVSKSGNPAAFDVAQTMRSIYTHMREEYKRLGVDIGNIENYMGWQRYDRVKVGTTGKDGFVADMLNHSDHAKTFTDAITDAEKIVRAGEMYDHIMGGGSIDVTQTRSIHYGSGEAVHAMMTKYGISASAIDSIDHQISYTSRVQGLMSVFGPEYKDNFDRALALAQKQSGTAEHELQAMWTNATGKGRFTTDANSRVAAVGKISRNIQQASKLGGAAISALGPDMAMTGARVEATVPGGGVLTSFKDVLVNYKSAFANTKEQHSFYNAAGMMAEDLKNSFLNQVDDNGGILGASAKAAAMTHKWSGLAAHDRAMTTATIRTLGSRLYTVADQSFAQLDPKITHNFKRYGIGEKEWDIIRMATHEYGESKTLMPSAIMDMETKLAGGKYFQSATYLKYANYIQDMANSATLKSDIKMRSAFNMGLPDDHWASQLIQTFGQFKSASVQAVRTMKYIANADPKYANAKYGDWQSVAKVSTMLAAVGYVTASAKELIKGNSPLDPTKVHTWMEAIARGGAGGPMADYMARDYSNDRSNLVVDLAGPVFSQVSEGAQVLSKAVRGKKGTISDAAGLIQSNIPGNNIFYVKMAYNYVLGDHLMDYVSPGRSIRQANALKARGQRKLFSGLGADNQNTILGGGN